jgi:nucleoside-diphosphate-sugar epimerase
MGILAKSAAFRNRRTFRIVKVLVTGASGFICGYLIQELLEHGYEVVGLDNFSKYGRVQKSYDTLPGYRLVEGNAKDVKLMKELLSDCDHFIAAAAMIGGISYFHEFAYDLLAENERIIASSFDAAIWAHRERKLKKIVVLSSSMVFESTSEYPTPEGAERRSPPPRSTYGFQKLATEYFVQGAYEQYKLPYTIVRPFNCVGIGEKRALSDRDIMSGNVRLAMSHVVPDLVQKLVKGQDPLHILGDGKQVRHYTYGGDLARGIRICTEHPSALNQDFNLSTPVSTTVLELAELIWQKIHGSSRPFRYVSDPAYEYDVQERSPATGKAKDLLGFEASTPLSEILDEVIPWVAEQVEIGQM